MISAFGLLIVSAINLWPIHAAAQTKRSSIVEEVYKAYTHPSLRGQALVITGICMLGGAIAR